MIEVSGTYTYAPGGRIADAEFAYDPDGDRWLEELPGVINREFNLELLVNETPQNWLGSSDGFNFYPHTLSPDHTYQLSFTGQGSPVSFRIYDSSYDWNSGFLTVSLETAPIPEPSTITLLGIGIGFLTLVGCKNKIYIFLRNR
jgi:hypothetical protein